MFTKLHDGVHE